MVYVKLSCGSRVLLVRQDRGDVNRLSPLADSNIEKKNREIAQKDM